MHKVLHLYLHCIAPSIALWYDHHHLHHRSRRLMKYLHFSGIFCVSTFQMHLHDRWRCFNLMQLENRSISSVKWKCYHRMMEEEERESECAYLRNESWVVK